MADVIVNTSPLQYLHQVGRLDLFQKLFGRIIVPEAVVAELAAGRQRGVSLPTPEALNWVDLRSPASPIGGLLSWDLGAGESAVLSLALEHPGSWVVLDDKLARQAAVHLNLPALGTAGILLRAKRARAPSCGSSRAEPIRRPGLPTHTRDGTKYPQSRRRIDCGKFADSNFCAPNSTPRKTGHCGLRLKTKSKVFKLRHYPSV